MKLLSEEFRFVMCSKLNRERLDLFRVMNMLYTQAALNTPSGHLLLSKKFSNEAMTLMSDNEQILL